MANLLSRFRRLGLAAALGLIAPTVSPAQEGDHLAPFLARSSCLDSIPPAHLTRIPVYASVKLADSASSRMRPDAENLLQEIAFRVQALLGAAPNVLPAAEPRATWRGLGAPLTVTVRRDRGMTRRIPADRNDTTAAALLARAIDSMPPDAFLFNWSADSLRDSLSFDIVFGWPFVHKEGKPTMPQFTSAAIPVFSVAHPWELSVAPKPGNRGPRYPETARDAGYTAYVIMVFIVDTAGHAVMSTVRDVWPKDTPRLTGEKGAQYNAFVQSIRRSVEKMSFYPAEIGGCKTAQPVQLPFEFHLTPPSPSWPKPGR